MVKAPSQAGHVNESPVGHVFVNAWTADTKKKSEINVDRKRRMAILDEWWMMKDNANKWQIIIYAIHEAAQPASNKNSPRNKKNQQSRVSSSRGPSL